MGVYDPNFKTLAGNKAYTDAQGLTVRNMTGGALAPATSGGAVAGQSSGRTRAGATIGGSGRETRTDTSQAHSGGRGAITQPTPDFAARAAATANSGAAAQAAAGAAPTGTPEPNPYGSESGNTYLEDRYLQRLYGNDPAFNYAAKRGGDALDARMAAGGSFNSGARGQQQSDMYANLLAQSQGQLDALAAGASGARQNKLNSMFGSGLGLAGGEAGTGGAYDLKGADSANAMNQAILMMMLNKAGVDSKSNSAGIANIGALGSIFG